MDPKAAVARLTLALALLPAPAAAEPATRPVSRRELPSLVFGAVKEWAKTSPAVDALEEFIRDSGAWTPPVFAAAGAAGAAVAWFEGGRGTLPVGAWRLSVAGSGRGLRDCVVHGNGRLVKLGLGRPDRGLSAYAALGLREGRFLSESYGLAYSLRY